jgi:gas vesicle protein
MTMDGKHIDKSTQMTYILNRIIGKKVSVSMIRNIFATDNGQETKQELKKAVDTLKDTAQEMGTSVNMLINNYTKNDE